MNEIHFKDLTDAGRDLNHVINPEPTIKITGINRKKLEEDIIDAGELLEKGDTILPITAKVLKELDVELPTKIIIEDDSEVSEPIKEKTMPKKTSKKKAAKKKTVKNKKTSIRQTLADIILSDTLTQDEVIAKAIEAGCNIMSITGYLRIWKYKHKVPCKKTQLIIDENNILKFI